MCFQHWRWSEPNEGGWEWNAVLIGTEERLSRAGADMDPETPPADA